MEITDFIQAIDGVVTAWDDIAEVKYYVNSNIHTTEQDKEYYKVLTDLDRFYNYRLGKRYTKAEREIINVDDTHTTLTIGQEQVVATLYNEFIRELETTDELRKTLAVRITDDAVAVINK